MRLFTLIGVIIWNSQHTQTTKSCSRTNTLVQVWIEHTFTFCMTSTGMNRSNWNLDLKSFSYFSHYVSHSLKWSFGKLSACKLPKLALLYFSHHVSHSNFDHPVTMLLFTIIRSDRLKHSTHTNCQQVALMHTLVPCCVCVYVTRKHTFFFAFHWDEPDHLKLRCEKKTQAFFSHYVLHSLEWSFGNLNAYKLPELALLYRNTNSQNSHSCPHPTRIQVYFTYNEVIFLSQIKRVYLSVDSYNYEPTKTEWSQSW